MPKHLHRLLFALFLALPVLVQAQTSEAPTAGAAVQAALPDTSDSGSDPVPDDAAPAAPAADPFTLALEGLQSRSFNDKEAAVGQLEASGNEHALTLLRALLNGEVFIHKDSGAVVVGRGIDSGYAITSAADARELGSVGSRDVKKVVINNKMRNALRAAIARLSLSSPDPDRRLAAVNEMIGDIDADSAALLHEALPGESNTKVVEAIRDGLAIADLSDADPAQRLAAIDQLRGSLRTAVYNRLSQLIDSEQDAAVKAAARTALNAIDAQRDLYAGINTLFFGLSLGSVLLLAAIGLAITFGVMGVINMAHGELIMLGAYTTYVVQLLMPNAIEWSLLVAIPAAFIVAGAVGIAIERGVIRHLYGRPLETLLATFGLSLILQQVVRSIFSPLNRSVQTPDWMSGSWEINPALALTYNRLYIIIFGFMVFFALLLILKKTTLGLKVRAVTQNRAMARSMGVRSDWVDAATFGLGSGIAGVAGVALSQLTNVGPNLGQGYIIDSFMVVVFGGVGNLWGTLVGAMSLGVVNKVLEPWSGAVLAKILVLVAIILFIQKRPRGLFPQKGRAAEA